MHSRFNVVAKKLNKIDKRLIREPVISTHVGHTLNMSHKRFMYDLKNEFFVNTNYDLIGKD